MNQKLRGTCEQLCPDREAKMRTTERLLHFFEEHPPASKYATKSRIVCVTEFARSAAGCRTPRATDLRTVAALRQTVDYLLEHVLFDARRPFWFVYEFVFNRLRCVRQEIVMQQLGDEDTVQLLQPIVQFLAYAAYRLCEQPIDRFDPFVCNQHLLECLKKLLCGYDRLAVRADDDRSPAALRHRPHFEAMYQLFNLGHADAIKRGLVLPERVRMAGERAIVQRCLRMSLWQLGRRHRRVIGGTAELPALLAAVVVPKLPAVRRELFREFACAYRPHVPVFWVQQALGYETRAALIGELGHYRVSVLPGDTTVRLAAENFRGDVIGPVRQEHCVRFADDRAAVDALLLRASD